MHLQLSANAHLHRFFICNLQHVPLKLYKCFRVCVCWNLVLMRTRKRRGSQNNKVLIISAQHYGPGSYSHRHIAASTSSAQAKLQKNTKKKLFKILLHAICIFIYYIIIFCNFSFHFFCFLIFVD